MSENKNYRDIKRIIDDLINRSSHGKYIFKRMNQVDNEERVIGSPLFRKYDKDNIWNRYFSPKHAEKEIVEKAKKFFSPSASHIEILTDLRHYGCKVNLIDFTCDLYVALFFACNGEMDKDGQLAILNVDKLKILKDIYYEKDDHKVALIKPVKTSISWNQMVTQNIIFIHSSRGYISKNQCIIINIECQFKRAILDYLKKFHNISSDNIYNDLIGFVDNEENYSSSQIKFYKGLALMKEAENTVEVESKEEKYKRSITAYNEAIELNSENDNVYNNRGYVKIKLNRYKEAIFDCDKAIELRPDNANAYNNRGLAKDKLGQHEEAIADYNRAIEINSDDAQAYNYRGLAKSQLDDNEDAITDYNKAIEINPEDTITYYNRGFAKTQLGYYEEAITDYSKAIEITPGWAEAYWKCGFAKDKLGQHEEAITDYNRAIVLDPKLAEAYNNRGVSKKRLGQHEEAIIDYNKAIEINPDLAEAYNNRGVAKSQLGLYKKAITDYNKAVALNPDLALTYSNRGFAKAHLGQYEDAIFDLEKSIGLSHELGSKLKPIINKLENKLNKLKNNQLFS